jgi:hypothetical protein
MPKRAGNIPPSPGKLLLLSSNYIPIRSFTAHSLFASELSLIDSHPLQCGCFRSQRIIWIAWFPSRFKRWDEGGELSRCCREIIRNEWVRGGESYWRGWGEENVCIRQICSWFVGRRCKEFSVLNVWSRELVSRETWQSWCLPISTDFGWFFGESLGNYVPWDNPLAMAVVMNQKLDYAELHVPST